ncbi:MAG: sugar phosphate nucleotidyltransferase, partial [Thermoplasmata archaeon]|nr:sugar phosphate nucleotidyltransferase [Thermoplasmata archaeon]
AAIICGGLGTRLRPLTFDIPKSMVPVNGKPFLQIILENFREQGIKRFVLCSGNLHENIEAHFGDGSKFGVEIINSPEPEPLGTGGALLNARHLLDDRFFLAYGDSYLPVELELLDRIMAARDALGVIAVYENKETLAPNNVRISGDGRVLEYIKKNPPASMNCLEAGLSLYRRDILDLAPGRQFSLEEVILPQLINRGRLFGLLTPRRFYDMGTPEGLKRARRELNDTD